MLKDRMIVAGLGQCGCVITNEMVNMNKRYFGCYVNSAIGDVKNLNNIDMDNDVFIFSGMDGTGRNRKLVQQMAQKDILRLSPFVKKYNQFKYMLVVNSFDGGTGSGLLPLFIKTVKMVLPHIKINVLGILPRLDEDNLKLENTLDCLQELESVIDMVNDLKFINNNCGYSYDEINEQAIHEIDMAYSITGSHKADSIDNSDSENVNNCVGYGFILNLPERYNSIESALTIAKENSIFAVPNSFDCMYAGINVKEGVYDINELRKYIKASKSIYKTYNNKFNVIVLGGCDTPSEQIENIKNELQDRKDNNTTRVLNRSFGVNKDRKEETKQKANKKVVIEDEDLDDLFDDSFFRF